MLLDEVGRHLMKVVGQLAADDVAAAVHAYASLGHSPSLVLFEALAQRAAQLAPHFSPDQRALLADSYERLGYASLAPSLGG
jgi:L-alanine-DL-glutamate epimerase-like enolase superfamily enzyme